MQFNWDDPEQPLDRRLVALPDGSYVDAFIGYRAWRVRCVHGNAKLFSMSWDASSWPVGVLEATCFKHREHRAPARGAYCECGVYAWRSPMSPARRYQPHKFVLGEVALWGTVRQHTLGYRSSHAMITGLWTSPSRPTDRGLVAAHRLVVEIAAEQYGVPLILPPDRAKRLIEPV